MLEVFQELQSALNLILNFSKDFIFPVIRTWWWVVPPFLLFGPAKSLLLWWRQELAFKEREYVMLEIKLPRETLKPIKAMEDVFSTFYMIATDQEPGSGSFKLREKWIEGVTSFYPSISLEIASFEGETHFFIRMETTYRDWVETAIYSQYPDIEIVEAKDYVELVPQDIPNDKWDLEGRDWILAKEDCYPIRTYEDFETGTEPKEEKRVDPMAKLLEGLSALEEGEQVWIQILLADPETMKPGKDWIKEGEKIRDKLAMRPGPEPGPKSIPEKIISIITGGGVEEKKEEEEEKFLPPEMKLTPGEREVIKGIEKKISKPGLAGVVRLMYLGKKNVFFKPNLGLPTSFLVNFNTGNLNRFAWMRQTTTKVKTTLQWMNKRKAFIRKRKMFRNYKKRFFPLFPSKGGVSIFNLEELASLYHFPSSIVAPAPFVPRVEAKKGEAPPELPGE